MKSNWTKAISILKNDEIIIAPTDTLYGVLGSAFSKKAVKKIYALKGRDEGKPCIVLISSIQDLKKFGISCIVRHGEQCNFCDILKKIWSGKVSVILPCQQKKFEYLHRGTGTIAFRMIDKQNKNLFDLIKKVGPLLAPSANPQGKEPAYTISQAKKYFGDKVDLYIDEGVKRSKSSTLVEIKNGKLNVLRQGVVMIPKTIL